MKPIIYILTCSVMTYPVLDTAEKKLLKKKDPIEYRVMMLEEQLKTVEKDVIKYREIEEIKFNQLSQQLTKLESKFDSYFLWGYGTLIALILAILGNGLWMKKRQVNTS